LGEWLHIAKAWARNKHASEAVLQIEVEEDNFLELDPLNITYNQACQIRSYIRKKGLTRSYKFDEKVIWAPIVGTETVRGKQFKWEWRC